MNARALIKKLAENPNESPTTLVCKVLSNGNKVSTCEPINGDAEIYDVRWAADDSYGFYAEPNEGSIVLVTKLDNHNYFISLHSEVKRIWLQTAEQDNGGLIKIGYLLQRLSAIESVINRIATHTHGGVVPPDPSIGSAGSTVRAQLENTKVIH